ncbi:MAG: hypothetical protein COZ91_03470 [Candidatus Nealsonbacteria bacterium CG_4_8_14_3_um_filter_39_7]|uniref:Uncharacterized protein n=1 Tax=Candidatus Nealsonbacteria bacterium CG23_combo_of_CG06-09_8_20_14_all_39_17 TaxID=1974722 RepID=A0A2G9YTY8_9BACT|nr:MAG: hypothetical protein COX37_02915 [Candidatus Nealsonbacteria bacterium CG23_combo_of_CG06-09_8_20_14_all_39_17]PIU43787.1 MAG: hypothetical protein COS96_02530 [Candidatus Nealsonbacteria bacterium CG07_land_8_20_14_0_80_39_13]PIW90873.1 MAG: hypothetical protein COZ91_03470 [Candidatus Nealsonbacteria bacterium CG_4_8_14_3_um_filter_39_7]
MSEANLSDYVNGIKGKVEQMERDMRDWKKCLEDAKKEIEKQIEIIDREVLSEIKSYENSDSPLSKIKDILDDIPTK